MKIALSHILRRRKEGGILITTVILVALMSMMTAATLYRVSSRYAATYQSVCWNEAMSSAEGGADLALVALNNSLSDPSTAWAGWTPSDASTFPKTYIPAIADHGGEGNTKVFTKIVVDTGVGGGWIRVRSMGVAELPSRSSNGLETAVTDTNGLKNHRSVLRKPRFISDVTGGRLHLPQVTRTVEVLAAPALSYPYMRPLTTRGSITMNGGAWTDSFNSTDPAHSTNTQYDFSKHLSHGDIATNSSGNLTDLNNCYVYGNASSNGGAIGDPSNVQGVVTNNFQTTIADIPDPVFASVEMTPTTISNPGSNVTLVGGTAASPKNYKLNQLTVSGSVGVILAPPAPGVESYLNIWVTGKVALTGNAYILQQPGVHVTFYGDDDMKFTGNGYMNQNSVASTLQLFGVSPKSGGSNHSLQVGGNGDFIGVINAPAYDVTINGNGALVGTVIGKTATITGGGGFHYDEALGSLPSPVASSYQYVSWVEDIR